MSDTMSSEKNVEYIREFTDTITRAIVAYVNSDGGKIYVGLDEFGKVNGVADPDDVVKQIETLARTRVKPDPRKISRSARLSASAIVQSRLVRSVSRV